MVILKTWMFSIPFYIFFKSSLLHGRPRSLGYSITFYRVFFNYLSALISWLIEGQAIISGKPCLPAFSIGNQYDGLVMFFTASILQAAKFNCPDSYKFYKFCNFFLVFQMTNKCGIFNMYILHMNYYAGPRD